MMHPLVRPNLITSTTIVGEVKLTIEASGRVTMEVKGEQGLLIRALEEVLSTIKAERAGIVWKGQQGKVM
jgi:hypothetical protein